MIGLRARPSLSCALFCALLLSSPAHCFDTSSFRISPLALTATTGDFGPQLGLAATFTGFNGDPAINAVGDIVYPGNISPAVAGAGEGYWMNQNGQNLPIAVTNNDGPLGPALGSGIVFDNMFHEALPGAPGEALMGGFLSVVRGSPFG